MGRMKIVGVALVLAVVIAAGGCRQVKEYEYLHDDVSPAGWYDSKGFRDVDAFNRATEPSAIYEHTEALEDGGPAGDGT